jgi:hypothetical protein
VVGGGLELPRHAATELLAAVRQGGGTLVDLEERVSAVLGSCHGVFGPAEVYLGENFVCIFVKGEDSGWRCW